MDDCFIHLKIRLHEMTTNTISNTLMTSRILNWGLIVITSIVMLAFVPRQFDVIAPYAAQLSVYLLLTALTLFLGIRLSESELSPAHAFGIMAFLSLPVDIYPATLWAIFIGGLIGGGMLVYRARRQVINAHRNMTSPVYALLVTTRLTLSFFIASQAYLLTGNTVPLNLLLDITLVQTVLSVVAFALVYIAIYLLIFVIELIVNHYPVQAIFDENKWHILTIMIVPAPFAVLGAEVVSANSASATTFFILVSSLLTVVLGMYALGRSEHQMRKQVEELRSLSAVTQAMRSNLDLPTLLKTIYLQVANILKIENFFIALYDSDDTQLEYRLVMSSGEQRAALPEDHSSLVNHVIETQTILSLESQVTERARALNLQAPQAMITSWCGIPLLAGGRIMGVMAVFTRDPNHHLLPEDIRLLNVIAASSSIAIENARLYQQKSDRAERLNILNNVSALLTGTLSPDEVLDTIISSASTVADATAVAVHLYEDESSTAPVLAGSAGLSDTYTSEVPQPLLVKDGQQLTNLSQPIVIVGAQQDPRTVHLHETMRRESKNALVELPLMVGTQALGILVLFFNDVQHFSGEHIELMRTFASQAAQAINNAQRFTTTDKALERRVEQLFALAALGRLLNATLSPQQMFDVVMSYATDATKAEFGALVIQSENGTPQATVQRGYVDAQFEDSEVLKMGTHGHVMKAGQLVRVDDITQETSYKPFAPQARSMLVTPLTHVNGSIGTIILESDRPNAFSEEDGHFIAQIANQAAIALNNLQLFQRIREARDRLQVILDAMEEAIILINSTGEIVMANPRISLIGLKHKNLLQQQVNTLLADTDMLFLERLGFHKPDLLLQIIDDLKTPGQWTEIEPHTYSTQGEHGLLYIRRHIIPIRGEQGHVIGALLVFYNRTEEHELARAQEDLSRMIVHDMRSPLTAVTTSLRLLRDLTPPENDLWPVVDKTTDASRRALRKLLARVDSLLDISKMESGTLSIEQEPAELATLADSVCVELSPLAHEIQVKLSSDIEANLPFLNIDTDKVERVLLNLVDNALKYTAYETEVQIRAGRQQVNGSGQDPKMILVEVIDQGPGIPDDYKEHLFDRYVQIEGRRKVRRGVGLGLTFCKMVAEAHGGRMWIEDNPTGGSIFKFTLPIADLTRLPDDDDFD